MTCVGGWKHAQKTAFSLTINGTQISKEEYIQCMNLVQYNTMVTLRSEKHDVSEDELLDDDLIKMEKPDMNIWRSRQLNS